MRVLVVILVLSGCCFAQDVKPNVTVSRMTDAEFKKLDDASSAMQKAAEAYTKAANEYAAAKADVLGKYNALESSDCKVQKIVDVRGQFIIIEVRPQQTYYFGGSLITAGCGTYFTNPAYINASNALSFTQ